MCGQITCSLAYNFGKYGNWTTVNDNFDSSFYLLKSIPLLLLIQICII